MKQLFSVFLRLTALILLVRHSLIPSIFAQNPSKEQVFPFMNIQYTFNAKFHDEVKVKIKEKREASLTLSVRVGPQHDCSSLS